MATANFVSAVPVRVEGFEAEVEWRPSDRFNITGNLSYSRGRIRNGNIPCLDLNGDGVPDTATATPTLTQLDASKNAVRTSRQARA